MRVPGYCIATVKKLGGRVGACRSLTSGHVHVHVQV